MNTISASTIHRDARPRRRLVGALRAGIAAVAVVLVTLAMPARPASADVTFNQRVLDLVNRDRTANGLKALALDTTMAATAEDAAYTGCGFTVNGRAKDMGQRNYFSHTILGCASQGVFNILNSTGLVYSGAAENIGWMNATTDPSVAAENIYSQWMNSSGHRNNILNPNWTKMGVGSWRTSPGQTWSGGGFALPNVWIGVQIFAGGPVSSPPPPPPPPAGTTGRFTSLTPARILDTRDGTGGFSGAVAPGGTIAMQIAGRGGIPTTDVAGVALTVTVTQPSEVGYLSLYPSGTSRPTGSNINFVRGETVSNLAVIKVGADGKVNVFNSSGTTHVVVDVAGWYSGSGTGNAGRFEPVVPSRILDTRTGAGATAVRLASGGSLDLQVTGRGGLPTSGAQAAVLNVTVTNTASLGFLTAFPTGESRPLASNLTFAGGTTVAARTMVKLGTGGKVTIYNGGGATDVIVDVSGWYTDASVSGTLGAFTPVSPARILDTRIGIGGITGPVPASGTVDVQVAGAGGVPASGARAVILNVTVTEGNSLGHLTIFPAGTARPVASDVNFAAGDTQANLVVVKLGTGGKVSLFSAGTTHVIFDVAGWIS